MRCARRALLGASLLCCAAPATALETVWVAVKETALRAENSYLAPTVARLSYTAALEVRERAEDWLRVSSAEHTGWIHQSAVSADLAEPDASAGGGFSLPWKSGNEAPRSREADGGYNDDEITLAGKGFNAEVEARYRTDKRGEVDYEAVDAIEKLAPPPSTLAAFAAAGELGARELPAPSAASTANPLDGLKGLFD